MIGMQCEQTAREATRKIDFAALRALCLDYDVEYGDFRESQLEGLSVFSYACKLLGVAEPDSQEWESHLPSRARYYERLDEEFGVIAQEPSAGGRRRYPDGCYDGIPCTCRADCPDACKGGCGCAACSAGYADALDARDD